MQKRKITSLYFPRSLQKSPQGARLHLFIPFRKKLSHPYFLLQKRNSPCLRQLSPRGKKYIRYRPIHPRNITRDVSPCRTVFYFSYVILKTNSEFENLQARARANSAITGSSN